MKRHPKRKNEIQKQPVNENFGEFIKSSPTFIEPLNSHFDGNLNEAKFFVPTGLNENIISACEEPYNNSVSDIFREYITSPDSTKISRIPYRITQKASDQYHNIMITNANIIFSNGFLGLIKHYTFEAESIRTIDKLYLDKFNEICSDISRKCSDFQELVYDLDKKDNPEYDDFYNIREYQRNKNELDLIMTVGLSVSSKFSTLLTNYMYQFINEVVFGDLIDFVRFASEAVNQLMPEGTAIPESHIMESSQSLTIQYLLEVLNNDIAKILYMSDIIYLNTVNVLLHDLSSLNGMRSVTPLVDKKY